MSTAAVVIMIVTLGGYFGAFFLLLSRAFKRQALRDGSD